MKTLVLVLWISVGALAAADDQAVVLTLSTNRAAGTNIFTRHPLALTSAQAKLNASPYFASEINDFKKLTQHRLKNNLVEPGVAPEADFNAVFLHGEGGERECFLKVVLSSTKYRDWSEIGTNHLELIIDGTTTVHATHRPESSFFQHTVFDANNVVVVESELFPVSEDLIRGIASAMRVQFRVEGERKTVQRTLGQTNIQRFKIFVQTFLDSK